MICFSSYTNKNNAILSLADDAMVIAPQRLHDKVQHLHDKEQHLHDKEQHLHDKEQHLHDKVQHASEKRRFCFNDASNEYCWNIFRFKKDDLSRQKSACTSLTT